MKKLITALTLLSASLIHAQSITEWTEAPGALGLGYPVPIPVDTPEPFDGFRTYSGLFAKHQSIASENPYVNGHIVGQTHYERDIWAYVFSDEDNLTRHGLKEGVMMVNGNIHAREWQSPEVVTGIMELLHDNSDDQALHQYLLENTSIIIVPVNNVDGLLQTQRYPTQSWFPSGALPRDGRMRRKNMRDTDEDMSTKDDHRYGVDLNRNNAPFWATSIQSSADTFSLLYHGVSAHSEPETLARLAAADLAPADQFRVYTDVHSYTKLHFAVDTRIDERNEIQEEMLLDFSKHHVDFADKWYHRSVTSSVGRGIGSTDEYFAYTYQIPSWTLEVEPGAGAGTEYGGFTTNDHSGFILPESEIRRVREQLAASFMVAWYSQSGPPSITQLRIREKDTGLIVYDAEWDLQTDGVSRVLHEYQTENILPGVDYQMLVSFDKPMRQRSANGSLQYLQGQPARDMFPDISAQVGEQDLMVAFTNEDWVAEKSDDFVSYKFYKDDSFVVDFNVMLQFKDNTSESIQWSVDTADMVGQKLDSNPATAVSWADGSWVNYEDSDDNPSITGGVDATLKTTIASEAQFEFPPKVQNSGLYYNPDRSGEGFSYELLDPSGRVWLQWYTYDEEGGQRWYSAIGQHSGNVIRVDELRVSSGGVFGESFDPDNISFEKFGSLEIIFSGGTSKQNPVGLNNISRTASLKFTDNQGQRFRTQIQQITSLKGNPSDMTIFEGPEPPETQVGDSAFSGSWYDRERGGEGYVIQILDDERAILVWFTYDTEGNHMWLLDSNGVKTVTEHGIQLDFSNGFTTQGGRFGDAFNPDDVTQTPWGSLQFQLSCDSGTVSYTGLDEAFGSATYNLNQVTYPVNLFSCD